MTSSDDTTNAGGAPSDEAAPRGAFSVRLPPALYRELRHHAEQRGTSMNNVIAVENKYAHVFQGSAP